MLAFAWFGQEQWLFIAWVFGREAIIQELAMDLVTRILPDDRLLRVSPMPPGIMRTQNDSFLMSWLCANNLFFIS